MFNENIFELLHVLWFLVASMQIIFKKEKNAVSPVSCSLRLVACKSSNQSLPGRTHSSFFGRARKGRVGLVGSRLHHLHCHAGPPPPTLTSWTPLWADPHRLTPPSRLTIPVMWLWSHDGRGRSLSQRVLVLVRVSFVDVQGKRKWNVQWKKMEQRLLFGRLNFCSVTEGICFSENCGTKNYVLRKEGKSETLSFLCFRNHSMGHTCSNFDTANRFVLANS